MGATEATARDSEGLPEHLVATLEVPGAAEEHVQMPQDSKAVSSSAGRAVLHSVGCLQGSGKYFGTAIACGVKCSPESCGLAVSLWCPVSLGATAANCPGRDAQGGAGTDVSLQHLQEERESSDTLL